MARKGNSTLPRPPELEPHHQMQFSVMTKTLFLSEVGLKPLQWIQSVLIFALLRNYLPPINISIDPTLSQCVWSDTRSLFKESKAGLNSDFSFSWAGSKPRLKNPVCSTHSWKRTDWFMPFQRVFVRIETCKKILSGLELRSLISFSWTITLTLSLPRIDVHSYRGMCTSIYPCMYVLINPSARRGCSVAQGQFF